MIGVVKEILTIVGTGTVVFVVACFLTEFEEKN